MSVYISLHLFLFLVNWKQICCPAAGLRPQVWQWNDPCCFHQSLIFLMVSVSFQEALSWPSFNCNTPRPCNCQPCPQFSESTSMVGSRILPTFRPFRPVSNDVLLIIWAFFFTLMMQHKGNTCCIKQPFVSWLHSGCTVEIFEPDNLRFLLGVILEFAFRCFSLTPLDGQRHTAPLTAG